MAGGGTDHQRIHCDLASHDSTTPPQVLPIGADAQRPCLVSLRAHLVGESLSPRVYHVIQRRIVLRRPGFLRIEISCGSSQPVPLLLSCLCTMRAFASVVPHVTRRTFSSANITRNATPVSDLVLERDAPHGHLPSFVRSHPALWASMKTQMPSAIATLGARFHLISPQITDEEYARRSALLRVACTHPSVLSVQQTASSLPMSLQERQQVRELQENIQHNAQLSTIGNSLLGLLTSEYFHLKYPHLPTRVLKAFVSAYAGPSTLADVGAELGVLAQGVQRWDRTGASSITRRTPRGGTTSVPLLSKDVAAQSVRAIVAVLFQELGMPAVRGFVHSHLLSRRLDLASLLKFRDPKRVLSSTCKKYGKPAPQSRMLAETGRLSIHPVFVVGVYSGAIQLGEGTGSSIRMAEFRAAEDALRRLYLSELPDGSFTLPSTTLDASFPGLGTLPHSLQRAVASTSSSSYVPQPLGRSEVLHESRG